MSVVIGMIYCRNTRYTYTMAGFPLPFQSFPQFRRLVNYVHIGPRKFPYMHCWSSKKQKLIKYSDVREFCDTNPLEIHYPPYEEHKRFHHCFFEDEVGDELFDSFSKSMVALAHECHQKNEEDSISIDNVDSVEEKAGGKTKRVSFAPPRRATRKRKSEVVNSPPPRRATRKRKSEVVNSPATKKVKGKNVSAKQYEGVVSKSEETVRLSKDDTLEPDLAKKLFSILEAQDLKIFLLVKDIADIKKAMNLNVNPTHEDLHAAHHDDASFQPSREQVISKADVEAVDGVVGEEESSSLQDEKVIMVVALTRQVNSDTKDEIGLGDEVTTQKDSVFDNANTNAPILNLKVGVNCESQGEGGLVEGSQVSEEGCFLRRSKRPANPRQKLQSPYNPEKSKNFRIPKIPERPTYSFYDNEERRPFYEWLISNKNRKATVPRHDSSLDKNFFQILLDKKQWIGDDQFGEVFYHFRKRVLEESVAWKNIAIMDAGFYGYFNPSYKQRFLRNENVIPDRLCKLIDGSAGGTSTTSYFKSWYTGVTKVFTHFNLIGKHWIALEIDLVKCLVIVWDCNIQVKDDELHELLCPLLSILSMVLKRCNRFTHLGTFEGDFTWQRESIDNCPQDPSSDNCGVYTLKFIEARAFGGHFDDLDDDHIEAYREKMCIDLFNGKYVFKPLPSAKGVQKLGKTKPEMKVLGDHLGHQSTLGP